MIECFETGVVVEIELVVDSRLLFHSDSWLVEMRRDVVEAVATLILGQVALHNQLAANFNSQTLRFQF